MKLTNGEIYSAREPLKRILDEKLPVLASYKLAKLANKLNEQLKVIEEVRVGLIKKHGELGERGETVVPQGSPNFEKFVEEFNELMTQEVEVVIEKVKLPDTLEIEPSVLMTLERFVEV